MKKDQSDFSQEQKKYSKSMILLKSSVFALFIVFIVLLSAFVIIKNQKNSRAEIANAQCQENQIIEIDNEIAQIAKNGANTIILTKVKNSKQELIELNSRCDGEIKRIIFEIRH